MKYGLLSLVRSSQITYQYAMEIAACHNNIATAFIFYGLFEEIFVISNYMNDKL